MKSALLERFESGEDGTFGRLIVSGISFFTLERPWKDNEPNVSCIPLGKYQGTWSWSPALKRFAYLIHPVEKRSGIRVHSANVASQIQGCIALGEARGWIDGHKAILLSAPAIRRFESYMNREPFEMEVVNAY